MPTNTKPTAVHKLSPSHLVDAKQMEMLGGDVDIEKFHLQVRQGAGIDIVGAITDAVVDRTIEGASTLTVSLDDTDDRKILQSGRIGRRVDVNVDGLWWTLVAVKKTGRKLDLTFEEREVNLLRRYDTPIFADRANVTRAQFALRMIREVKETKLKWVIPELHIKQTASDIVKGQILVRADGSPLASSNQLSNAATSSMERGKGIPTRNSRLTVKGVRASVEQINNANIILATGEGMHAPRRILVCAIMTAIAESTIHNLTGGDRDSVGVFQQRKSQGWPASRNVATDATAFYQQAIGNLPAYKGSSNAVICQSVQRSAFSDGRNYAPWQNEAENFVSEFDKDPTTTAAAAAIPAGQVNNQTQLFVRGQISKARGVSQSYVLTPENSWNCMQRLAGEVNWRCFCVSGVIYFISDHWLMKSKPFMTLSEDAQGIDWIDCDYDEGKPRATATVTAHLSRWSAPPGCTVNVVDMGILNGKWLVDDVSRSLFDTIGTITLVKPLPMLPEPLALGGVPANFTGPKTGGGKGKDSPLLQGTVAQQKVVEYARSQIGVPYGWGMEQKGIAFDCSGLTQAAYATVGVSMSHNAQAQYDQGPKLSVVATLEPGDLVFFGTSTANIGHVGIYIGNGDMIDAPHTGAFVRVDKDFQKNWGYPDKYVGATRPWSHG